MSNLHTLVNVLIYLKDTNANPELIDKFSSFITEYEELSKEFIQMYPEEDNTTTISLS